MAKIEFSSDQKRPDFRVKITDTKCRRDFEFSIHGNEVIVTPGKLHVRGREQEKNVMDWLTALTPKERGAVFRKILSEYSASSRAAGWKAAAVVWVENPLPHEGHEKDHLLFIGHNTDRTAKSYFKDCAEQKAVSAATTWISQQQLHKHGDKETPAVSIKGIAIYTVRDPDPEKPGDKGDDRACACGKCTDMLMKSMIKGGEVMIIPRVPARLEAEIDDCSTQFSKVKSQDIWLTTIDNINRNQFIELSVEDSRVQKNGVLQAVKSARAIAAGDPTPLWDNISGEWIGRAADIAAQNTRKEHDSVPMLDAICAWDKSVDEQKMSQYLVRQIHRTLGNRLKAHEVSGTDEVVEAWIDQHIYFIRCTVIQLDDGSFRVCQDAAGKGERSYVNPEVSAVAQAVEKLGTNGIRAVWTCEFNPQHIKNDILHTSPKEAIERVSKQPSRELGIEGMKFHSIPFNDGVLSVERAKHLFKKFTFDISGAYPSDFHGTKQHVDRVAAKQGTLAVG